MRYARIAASSVLLGLALSITGCGDGEEQASVSDRAADEVATATGQASDPEGCTSERVGGSLTFGDFRSPTSLDPAGPNTASGVVGGAAMAAIFDVLVRYDAESGTFVPQVAESLTSNEDASEWTLKLRPGIRFGNGDPLDAAAVVASVGRFRDPAVRSARAAVVETNIAEIRTPDDLTVVFALTGPWGSFPWFLAGEGGMVVNTKVAKDLGEAFTLLPKGAGVGPYEPVKYAPNEEIVLQAKPDYWGGPVCVQSLRFVRFAGGAATYDALRTGSLDVGFLREPAVIADARDDEQELHLEYVSLGQEFQINARPGMPGADVRVRRAIALAVDPTQLDQRVKQGDGQPTKAIIGPGSRWYDGLDGPAYDSTAAKTLLQDVLAEGEYDGALRLLATDTPTGSATAQALQAMLNSVGFKVTLDLQTNTQQKTLAGDFDINAGASNLTDAAPYIAAFRYTSTNRSNIGQFKDPAYDTAVDRLKRATTDDETKAALAALQTVVDEAVPTVPWAATEEAIVSSPKVRGLKYTQATVTLFDDAYVVN